MGLISALRGAGSTVLGDQWKEYFYCDAIDADILVVKGQKRVSGRSSNKKGAENIISNGSVIAVNEGQCMIIVEQGKVVEVCAEAGEFIYDTSSEPSIFYGNLSDSIMESFKTLGKRFTFGGDAAKDQRVYYINIKEIIGNKYGTANAVPFRVVDERAGIDIDISIRCHGEYSYRITDPVLFYTNVCGNVETDYDRSEIDSQLKTELLTALQPAFAKISAMGIRYSALPGHTIELGNALNEVLSPKWSSLRGLSIVSVGVNSVKASEEDEAMLKELQRNAAFMDPTRAAAHLVGAQASAMQAAAANEQAGPAMAFMGMNMAGNAGGFNAQNLFAMGQQQAQQQAQQMAQQRMAAASSETAGWICSCGKTGNTGNFCMNCGAKKPEPEKKDSWTCSCGQENTGKFCMNCGKQKPAEDGWTCSCGKMNKGKFCSNCGTKKPVNEPLYKCDKCGWEPEDPRKAPRFCPQCGDPFNDEDIQ